MHVKKIKIFLGGYVNFLNAQNINCRWLSEHLDKEKFEISTLLFPFQNATDFQLNKSVKYIQLKRPVRLFQYLTYLGGIAKSDIAFLPKGEINRFNTTIAKLFNTRIIKTVEGIIDDINMDLQGWDSKKKRKYINHFRMYEPNLFAITNHIKKVVGKRYNFNFKDEILYLGVESNNFINVNKSYNGLKNIIFIGNKPSVKNIYDYFEASSAFPDINFHIVGGNQLKEGLIEDYTTQHNLTNVIYHGVLDHSSLSFLLSKMDLMYFPSRSEGFPKVHLETACAGVPTLCYGDYGASEWITSWKNGIIVDTKGEAIEAIKKLKENPDMLKELSINAVELGKSFDWKILVKKWEEVIERIYRS